VEVDLCGHATLATAHLLLRRLEPGRQRVAFSTRSGPLEVVSDGELLAMDFPAYPPAPVDAPAGLFNALGHDAEAVLQGNYLMVVVRSERAVRTLAPYFAAMDRAGINEAIVNARGSDCDCVFARLRGARDPGVGALQPGAVLGAPARQDEAPRAAGFTARGRALVRAARRPCVDRTAVP
jgi:predicted PhzF superfamily epimerase YddE/YHI9